MTARAAVGSRARSVAAALLHRWRGSLQLRVAATTLVLSVLLTGVVGLVLMQQVRSGVLSAKVHSSLNQLDFGLQHAAAQFGAIDPPGPAGVRATATAVVTDLAGHGNEEGSYGVVLRAVGGSGESVDTPDAPDTVPIELAETVSRTGREAWTYADIGRAVTTPALVVGAPVPTTTASYQLYYVFPLTQEQQTLALVERTMLLAGALVVLLLVVIALLVARQIVRPVRLAAATAERLAAGRLRDRMVVRGEDDLASLATSFNRMAETVERQILQLRELSRLQRRFVADVSHELRTPIATIRMAADVLHDARADLPPALARSAELLQAQLDRFEALVADLLEISRHDAGAVALEAEPVDLRVLVNRVAESALALATRSGCELRVDLPDQPAMAEVDARRIERVLRNLVVNAVEHGSGKPVEVTLRGDADAVAVTVRDHGVGLRPGDAALVFGRFWRADPARARQSGGTGLGLSIALEDARLHGGWLQAWGEPGQGSVFRLTLPWRAGETVAGSPLPLEVPAPASEVADA